MKLTQKVLIGVIALTLVQCQLALAQDSPKRIVSTHLCTDQYLLLLADRDRIVSLSAYSTNSDLSVLSEEAKRFPLNQGNAEEIVLFRPDLILTIQFGNPHVAILRKLGYRVVEIPLALSIDDIRTNILKISKVIGFRNRGEEMLKNFDNRLNVHREKSSEIQPVVAIYRANGYTSGDQTLISEILESASLRNLASELGIKHTRHLPLETLVTQRPDGLIINSETKRRSLAYELPSHPAIQKMFKELPRINLSAKYWTCGTPFVIDALDKLVEFRKEIVQKIREKN